MVSRKISFPTPYQAPLYVHHSGLWVRATTTNDDDDDLIAIFAPFQHVLKSQY